MKIQSIPIVGITDVVPFPYIYFNAQTSDIKSQKAIFKAIKEDIQVVITLNKSEDGKSLKPAKQGVLATIKQLLQQNEYVCKLVIESYQKVNITDSYNDDGRHILLADIDVIEEEVFEELKGETLANELKESLAGIVDNYFNLKHINNNKNNTDKSLNVFVNELCIKLKFSLDKKEKLLSLDDIIDRYNLLCELIGIEIYSEGIRNEIRLAVKEKIDKNQKEYILREELNYIRKELGDGDPLSDYEKYVEKIDELDLPEEVRKTLLDIVAKFKQANNIMQEIGVLKNYVDTVLSFPWNKSSEEIVDIKKARKLLEDEHYGLKDVKERILEFIAVRQFNPNSKAPIVCLVGPPGTGKTSIATSIAKSLNRKLARVSLGGITDESEIRGHRRTYLGAMPGRIVKALINVEVNNPIILFDEVDKIGYDHRGDPSSALLEVLDPEQNKTFRDNFFELPVDLSRVLFIVTANNLGAIPTPLRDRMDVIEVHSYTDNEKYHIAKNHLYNKKLNDYGISKKQINITDGALKIIIRNYLREAGVRQLERKIGEVIRKGAKFLLEHNRKTLKVNEDNLATFLGNPKYTEADIILENQVGIVHGLAWTSVGGCTLDIEVNTTKGKGHLDLTGQLGDVMKESAIIARAYVKSILPNYGKEYEDYFEKHDIHIHIPEGAIPKDGPSAGITMASALLSAIINRPARGNLCMTGEVTLRGRVLAIGGLKEKILAAKIAGITNVLVPFSNKKNIEELDSEIVDGLNIKLVKNMDEVLEEVFSEEL